MLWLLTTFKLRYNLNETFFQDYLKKWEVELHRVDPHTIFHLNGLIFFFFFFFIYTCKFTDKQRVERCFFWCCLALDFIFSIMSACSFSIPLQNESTLIELFLQFPFKEKEKRAKKKKKETVKSWFTSLIFNINELKMCIERFGSRKMLRY